MASHPCSLCWFHWRMPRFSPSPLTPLCLAALLVSGSPSRCPNGMLAVLVVSDHAGVRASCVAVVIVVVGVDASLIPINGPLGLNRRGAFVWLRPSFIYFIHVPGEARGGAYKAGTALTLKASLPPSASSWLKCWNSHHSKSGCDLMNRCSSGPCSPQNTKLLGA